MRPRQAAQQRPVPAPANGELSPALLRVIEALAEADEAEDYARSQTGDLEG